MWAAHGAPLLLGLCCPLSAPEALVWQTAACTVLLLGAELLPLEVFQFVPLGELTALEL